MEQYYKCEFTGLKTPTKAERCDLDIIKEHNKANEEERLTGCGLMGGLTMEEIESWDTRLKTSVLEMQQLAGVSEIIEEERKAEENRIKQILDEMTLLSAEATFLQKKITNLRKLVGEFQTQPV